MASGFLARIRGDHRGAAAAYFQAGRLEQAARMFEKAGEPLEAARLWLRSGREVNAIACLERVHPERAAELLSAEQRDDLAVRYFERGGSFWQAAECARRLRRHLRAARLFEQAGAFEQAAKSYADGGEEQELLRVWERLSEEFAAAGKVEDHRRIDLLRARRMVEQENLAGAAGLLERHGRYLVAAKLWQRLGQLDSAVAAYLSGGNPNQAAALLDSVNEPGALHEHPAGVDSSLRARVLEAVSRHEEAAVAYEDAGDISGAMRQLEAAGAFAAAARAAEANGSIDRAVDLWLAAHQPIEAARVLAEGGDMRAAAETARLGGENATAAGYYRQLGDHLRAAQEHIKGDLAEEAVADLEQVEQGSADQGAARRLLVPLLVASGRFKSALSALVALDGPDVASDASAFEEGTYWRARSVEGLGQTAEAIELLRSLVAQKPRYRDAEQRLKRLESGIHTVRPERPVLRSFRVGERLQGRYEIEGEAGRGGWSKVYRARDVVRHQPVAVKLMARRFTDGVGAESRLREEVRLCRRLKHPAIVRVFEHGSDDGRLFVVMEWAEGRTLQRLLVDHGPMSAEQTCDLAENLADGLTVAHRENVVHRDLTPANIVLSEFGAKIMDFGIALSVDGAMSADADGNVLGTPHYMSPEQIQGLALDGSSDLYSLGAVLFTCLAGHPPFDGRSATAISLKHLQDEPPDLRNLRPDLSPSLIDIVEKLLAKAPAQRFASSRDLGSALGEWRERALP